MLRAGVVMFCASAPFALLPTVAHTISQSAIGYGILLGCFGTGAVGGAVVMQAARARWSTEAVVSIAVAILGTMTAAMAWVHSLPGLMLIMVISGGAWISFISLATALVQTLAPDWVRARVLAIFMLITQGGLAAGSIVWGDRAAPSQPPSRRRGILPQYRWRSRPRQPCTVRATFSPTRGGGKAASPFVGPAAGRA